MKLSTLTIGACALAFSTFVSAAAASTVTVTTLDGSQGWYNPAGENADGGSGSITNVPIDGDGSLAVTGGRSRVVLGSLYGPGVISNLGTVSQFTDLSFSYEIDPSSTNNYAPKYSPALALTFLNGSKRDQLIYEAAYQPGGYPAVGAIGTLNVSNANSLFYLNSEGNPNHTMTLSDWSATLGSYIVGGVYIGVGGGAGSGYLAHVDDVIAKGTKYNFEVGGAAVPEPATWAMMLAGFGGIGAAIRRRRRMAVATA